MALPRVMKGILEAFVTTNWLLAWNRTLDRSDRSTGYYKGWNYRIYSHNLRTFFPSLAAEKSGCVKYADFFFFFCVEVLIWCVKWSVHTRIVEKQLKYLRCITVQSCSQLPQEQQPLMFKDKQQCWSTVFSISLWSR
jgi:hypothetical protein